MEGYAAYILTHYGSDPRIPSGMDTPQEFLAFVKGMFQNNAYKSLWLTIANVFNEVAGRSSYSD